MCTEEKEEQRQRKNIPANIEEIMVRSQCLEFGKVSMCVHVGERVRAHAWPCESVGAHVRVVVERRKVLICNSSFQTKKRAYALTYTFQLVS